MFPLFTQDCMYCESAAIRVPAAIFIGTSPVLVTAALAPNVNARVAIRSWTGDMPGIYKNLPANCVFEIIGSNISGLTWLPTA